MNTPSLIHALNEVLQQGLTLLKAVGADDYSRVLPKPYAASVGQHYRHVLEHFVCLVAGSDSGEVDYDARERDVHIETSITYAREVTKKLMWRFRTLTSSDISAQCSVRYSVGYSGDEPEYLASNLEREIAFCVGHAIHHYAIIRLVCAQIGVELPEDFGVAPSTIKHRATLQHAYSVSSQ